MPTLDTNCLVRWLVRDDPDKTKTMDAIMASPSHLIVPNEALIETVYVLETYYRFTRAEVTQAIRLLIGQAVLDLDRALWTQILTAYLEHPKLSCTDVFLAIQAKCRSEEPFLSFDRKLVNQLGAINPDAFKQM